MSRKLNNKDNNNLYPFRALKTSSPLTEVFRAYYLLRRESWDRGEKLITE